MRSILLTLLMLGAAVLCADGALAERRIALVVGNSSYTNTTSLRNPANDATLMAETLSLLGFEVTVVTDATRRDMAREILDFGKLLSRAGPDSVGLFYYAGHGIQANGTNYLIPLEARVDTEADLEIEAVNANWVLAQMDEAANGLNIVILDACRNNPFQGSFRSASRGLARLDAPAGSLIAYSAAPGQTAVDGDDKNSPYTRALADAMRTPGVELLQVFRRVRVDVESETQGAQTPWEEQSLRTDFFFVPPTAEPEPEQQVAVVVPESGLNPSTPDTQAPGNSSGVQLEILFWNSVKDSSDPDILQAYLNRYPNGVFAGLASVMIDRLREDRAQQSSQQPPAGQGQQSDQNQGTQQQAGQNQGTQQQGGQNQGTQQQAGQNQETQQQAGQNQGTQQQGGQNQGTQQQGGQQGAPAGGQGGTNGSVDVASVDPNAGGQQPSGPGQVEPQTYPELPRDLQAALDEAGCDPGPVDGIWGRRSQQALDKFARHASMTLPEQAISVATLEMVRGTDGRICPLECGRRYEERGGR